MLIKVDAQISTPLYLQVYQRIHEGIKSGQLQAQQRLPSIRVLASELNVARGTIELAYQMLLSEGIIESKGAKGTFVADSVKKLPTVHALSEYKDQYLDFEVENRKLIGNEQTTDKTKSEQNAKVITNKFHELQPFQLGTPALDAFPTKLWARISAKILRESRFDLLSYPDSQGVIELRQGLARYLMVSRGISCSAEQIFISFGHRASLHLITQCLFNYGDVGWFEEPGYHIARHFLQQIGLKLVPVSVDNHGLDVEEGKLLAPSANFVLVTPAHQSPTNVVLSLERRLALLEWANKQGSWIIEDDYDGEFHYQGRPLPALKSLDSQERVIYCGTFSKTLFPALRLSYIVVPPSVIAHFHSIAEVLGNQCPIWQQQVTSQFINDGHFLRHLRKMRNLYRQRKHFLIEAISEVLPNIFEIQPQSGGMHILVKLVNGKSAGNYVNLANEYGLKIESLNEWSIKNKVSPFLLLGFTNIKSKLEAVSLCEQLKIIDSKLV